MSITYQDVIDLADNLYPNGFDPVSKLKKITAFEQNLLRTVYRSKTATAYDILSGQYLYPLDYHPSKIIRVVWDGTTYEYEDLFGEDNSSPFLYTYERAIGHYPTPTADVSGGLIVYHYEEPKSNPTVDDYPVFDNDFPMVLVYDLCNWMAKRNREFDVANVYLADLSNELDMFKQSDREPGDIIMRVE